MLIPVPEVQQSRLSEFIANALGLHFPRERWADLRRGLESAARDFHFDDPALFADWLLATPLTKSQLQTLASHLTVGETYFLREKKTFDVLANHILPGLVRARRGREQRLRFWSAGCCTGEEAYSLAILLHQVIPDLSDWSVTVLATDVNARFLRRAVAGSYGEWSFRDTPGWVKDRYFNRTADGRYAILPEIRNLVTFEHLNLAQDVYPSLATNTNAMDVIFCRNVMMYFTPALIDRVIQNLHHALVDGGWLVVSPSEASHALFCQFATVNFPGVILYRRDEAKLRAEQTRAAKMPEEATEIVVREIGTPASWVSPVPVVTPTEVPDPLPEKPAQGRAPFPALVAAELLYREGKYGDAAEVLRAAMDQRSNEPAMISLLARALANQGNLADALAWCDRWVAIDKLDSAGHYLRAVILLEQGDVEQARASLQRAVYLHPEFALAHFALGNLARSRGRLAESGKHFANALELLRRCQANEILPESEGLTAGRLTETITAMIETETAS